MGCNTLGITAWNGGRINQAVLHPEVAASVTAMRELAAELETLRAVDGMIIQDKWATISVHYHMTRQRKRPNNRS